MLSNLNVLKRFRFNSLSNVFLSTNNKNSKKVTVTKEQIQLNNAKETLDKIKSTQDKQVKKESIRSYLNQKKEGPIVKGEEEAIVNMVPEEDNYCSLYYSLRLDKPFDIFDLRDFFYSFMYSKSMKGHCFLNVLDGKTNLTYEEKDKITQNFMEIIDWLGLEISFDKSLKNKLYESQRQQEYLKWMRLLLDQRDAYRCFCKTKTCEGKCETSVENSDSSRTNFTENKDISFIKYKVREKKITVHDIITSQNFELENNQDAHFNLYHRISPDEYILSSTFKRVIDDEIFKVTHKFELKNKYNFKRHLILTKALLFKEKKYAMLPIIKIVNPNKEKLDNYGVDYLKKKQFLPETILNEAALLGWSNIDKETRLEKMKKNENDYLLLDLYNVINEFDIKKIDAELAEFVYTRLYFINNKSLIKRFLKSNPSYRPMFLTEFKSIFRGYFKKYQDVISTWNEEYWQKILELVIPYLDTYENIPTKYQFLFGEPHFNFSQKNKKILKVFLKDKDRSYFQNLISELLKVLDKINNFEADLINRELGLFIYRRNELDKNISNDNIYSLLKFLVTGDTYGPLLADICVILGKKRVMSVLKNVNVDFLEKHTITVIQAKVSNQKKEQINLLEHKNKSENKSSDKKEEKPVEEKTESVEKIKEKQREKKTIKFGTKNENIKVNNK